MIEIHETVRRLAAAKLEEEVLRRDQYYGLDNWPYREVVDFVADVIEKHQPRGR